MSCILALLLFYNLDAQSPTGLALTPVGAGLSLIWKIVLVVELLGRPDGIGYAIQVFFQLFDIRRLIAYALAFVAVVLAVEWGVLQPLERRLARWRR